MASASVFEPDRFVFLSTLVDTRITGTLLKYGSLFRYRQVLKPSSSGRSESIISIPGIRVNADSMASIPFNAVSVEKPSISSAFLIMEARS